MSDFQVAIFIGSIGFLLVVFFFRKHRIVESKLHIQKELSKRFFEPEKAREISKNITELADLVHSSPWRSARLSQLIVGYYKERTKFQTETESAYGNIHGEYGTMLVKEFGQNVKDQIDEILGKEG